MIARVTQELQLAQLSLVSQLGVQPGHRYDCLHFFLIIKKKKKKKLRFLDSSGHYDV